MRTLTIATALVIASIGSAHAGCGGQWSFGIDIDETDMDRDSWSRSINTNTTFDDRNEYSVGISFSMPLGDDDCKYKRAQTAKQRADAAKADAEATYAANRAMKEEEFAIAKRIDNLQRIIVTCKTEDLAICDKIDEMSMELFN